MKKLLWNIIKLGLMGCVILALGTIIFGNTERRVYSLQKNTAKKFNKYQTQSEEGTFSPVIRLLRDKKFVCSGAVISDEYAVTAAHCVADENGVLIPTLNVQDETKTTTIDADVVGLNHRLDYALISGNFRAFKKFKVDEDHSMARPVVGESARPSAQVNNDPLAALLGVKTGATFVSCGFPMGSAKKFCTEFTAQADFNFQIVGTGTLYPGMSGGPVYDSETGVVYAVNSAVSGQYALVAPLVGILSCFNVD